MVLVTVDGNIGAGKSTLLRALRDAGRSTDEEPVEKWQPHLESMYTHKSGTFEFQLMAWLDRCWPRADQTGDLFIERSPMFQREVFVRVNSESGAITPRQKELLDDMYDRTAAMWSPDLMVYLRAKPDTCEARMRQRGRTGEDGLSGDYLSQLHAAHEAALEKAVMAGAAVVVLDVDNIKPEELADSVLLEVAKHRGGTR